MPWTGPHRLWRHLATDHRDAKRAFGDGAMQRIEAAIAAGEKRHRGQLRFVVEPALPPGRALKGLPPRERALEVFSLLRIWDTEENAGVLVYLLLADRDVEIVADRGIHREVGDEAWTAICKTMEEAFRDGRFAGGVEEGVEAINALLVTHFPRVDGAGSNELPDSPLIL